MARTTAVRLTGEDLTVSDVWDVAVGKAGAELDETAREKMAAARSVVEEALGRDEPRRGVGRQQWDQGQQLRAEGNPFTERH